MNSMEAKRVMNGKYADLYIDGDLMAEATAFKAEVTLTKEEVKMLRHVGKGYKVTGYTSAPYEKKGLFGHLKK